MSKVIIRKVDEEYGWLGNMSPHPVEHDGIWWKTAEALFQALRYPIGAVNEKGENIRELIRAQRSPMAAKMIAKAGAIMDQRNITAMGDEDLDNMRMVLRLKFKCNLNPLERDLLETGDRFIVEDVSNRPPSDSGRFWGAKRLADGNWEGTNKLGQLLMELRTEIRNRPAVQK